ncbi:MAG TPA: hypothetical protein VFY39_13875 [Gammaproteobacteria bacterium]|nr:hypothetical protein [Gammaproteobacteria bacterium]
MKRGLITWDRAELPEAVFQSRLAKVRRALAGHDAPALLVYTDVARSDQARHFTNFMPYWNRSLAVIPCEGHPVLLCGLSPRVYPWIRSLTIFGEIRRAPRLVPALLELCSERAWNRIAVLDLPRFPHEVHLPLQESGLALANLTLEIVDGAEIAMRRRAAEMARRVLAEALPSASGLSDWELSGRLERAFRRGGAEDLVLSFAADGSAPRPAHGRILGDAYSAAVAIEYRGHWAKVTRPRASADARQELATRFADALGRGEGYVESLADGMAAVQIDSRIDGERLFYGDTCWQGSPL